MKVIKTEKVHVCKLKKTVFLKFCYKKNIINLDAYFTYYLHI